MNLGLDLTDASLTLVIPGFKFNPHWNIYISLFSYDIQMSSSYSSTWSKLNQNSEPRFDKNNNFWTLWPITPGNKRELQNCNFPITPSKQLSIFSSTENRRVTYVNWNFFVTLTQIWNLAKAQTVGNLQIFKNVRGNKRESLKVQFPCNSNKMAVNILQVQRAN